MKRLWVLLVFVSLRAVHAQAIPAGIGPGPHVMVGGGYSIYQIDYGKRYLGGVTGYVDANLTWRWGLEGETRWLRQNEDLDKTHETTYLAGPRYSFSKYRLRPYAKVLGGVGVVDFPFGLGRGKYFVAAPGGGLEWNRGRFAVKLVDAEYQIWPQFTFGTINPYGVSAGITFRVWGSESKLSQR